LARAREKAAEQNVRIDFLRHDARNLPFQAEFDAAVMLCEGGFALMETDEMNFEILKSVARSLKNNGTFVFTTLNGLFPLYHSVEAFYAESQQEGASACKKCGFDLMTFRDFNVVEFEDDSGNKKTLSCNERYYVPSEITWLLKTLGFARIEIFGAKLGAYSRDDALTTDDFEMLVIAQRGTVATQTSVRNGDRGMNGDNGDNAFNSLPGTAWERATERWFAVHPHHPHSSPYLLCLHLS
jgi:SAM-dependent methyltransferase